MADMECSGRCSVTNPAFNTSHVSSDRDGKPLLAAQLLLLCPVLSGSNVSFIAEDITNNVIGITFMMLTVRVGLGLTVESSGVDVGTSQYPASSHPRTNVVLFHREVNFRDAVVDGSTAIELHLCKTSDEA